MARITSGAATAAHRTHQAVASCAGSLASQGPRYCHQPNLSLQLTPTCWRRCKTFQLCRPNICQGGMPAFMKLAVDNYKAQRP
jgi:hypothetical protein